MDDTARGVWVDEPVRIVAYDKSWPVRFERERTLLQSALGDVSAGGIHHVGSTAVLGLAAKPIIDILVGVEGLDAALPCFEAIAALGYVHAAYRASEMHWFCKPGPSRRTHHLHVVPMASRRFADELAFRDHLRSAPDSAAEYEALKRRLAERFAHDRETYTEVKGDFIRDVLAKARGQAGR